MSFLIKLHYFPFVAAYKLGLRSTADNNKGKAAWALNVAFFCQVLWYVAIYNTYRKLAKPEEDLNVAVVLLGIAIIYIFDYLTYLRKDRGFYFVQKIDSMPELAKKRFYIVSYLALALGVICAILLINISGVDDRSNTTVDRVFALLSSAPNWPVLDVNDSVRRKQIDEAYSKVAQYDDATIRAAMEKYVRCCLDNNNCGSAQGFSVFNMIVLNRFVFNVPDRMSKETLKALPFYLGMGVPQDEKSENILWPVTVAKDGSVVLTAQFYAHDGPLPDPLREFDIFEKTFGRRVTPKRSQ